MRILKTAEDEFRMILAPAEARIFINCMNETIKQVGARGFHSRMGATVDQIRSVIAALEAALK